MSGTKVINKFMILALTWVLLAGLLTSGVMLNDLRANQSGAEAQAAYPPPATLKPPAVRVTRAAPTPQAPANPLGLPALTADPSIWNQLAINQESPEVLQAAGQAFATYGFEQADPRLMCAEAATTMAMNYLNHLDNQPLINVGDTIDLVARHDWFSTPDGLLDSDGRIRIAENYGFKTYAHAQTLHGRPDQYLSLEEIKQFAANGYPVILSMRYQTLPDYSVAISTDANMEFNHSVLLVGYDAAQDEFIILSPLVAYNDPEPEHIRPQAVPADTFLASWQFDTGVGIGTVLYR